MSSSSSMGKKEEEDIYETDVDTGLISKVEAVVKHLRKPTETSECKQDQAGAAIHSRSSTNTSKQKGLSREVHRLTEELCLLDLNKTVGSSVEQFGENENDDDDDDDKNDDTTSDTENSEQGLLARGAVRGNRRAHRKEPYVTSASSPPSARTSTNHDGASTPMPAVHNEAIQWVQMGTQATSTSQACPPQMDTAHFQNSILLFPGTSPDHMASTTQRPLDHPPCPGTTSFPEMEFNQSLNIGFPQTIALDIPSFNENIAPQPPPTVSSEVDAIPCLTPSLQDFIYKDFSLNDLNMSSVIDDLSITYLNPVVVDNVDALGVGVGGEHATDGGHIPGHVAPAKDKEHTPNCVRQLSPTTDHRLQSIVPTVTLPLRSDASTPTTVLVANSSNGSAPCGNIPLVVPPDVDAIFTDCQEKKKPKKKRGCKKTDCKRSSLNKPETNSVLPMNIVHSMANMDALQAVTSSQRIEDNFEDAFCFIKSDTSAAVTYADSSFEVMDPSFDNADPNSNYTDTSLINPATKSRAGILPGQVRAAPFKPVGVIQSTQAKASTPKTACNRPTNPDTTIPQIVAQTTKENNGQTTPVGVTTISNNLPVSFNYNPQPSYITTVTPFASNQQYGSYLNPIPLPDMAFIGQPAGQAMPTFIPNGVQFQQASNMFQVLPVVPLTPQPMYQLVGNPLIQVPTIPANAQQMTVGSVPQTPCLHFQQPTSITSFQPMANTQVLASSPVLSSPLPGSTSLPVMLGSLGNSSSGYATSTTPPAGRELTSACPSQSPRQEHNNSAATSDQIKNYTPILPKRTES